MQTGQVKSMVGNLATTTVLCYFSLNNPLFVPSDMIFFDEKNEFTMLGLYNPNPYYDLYKISYFSDRIDIIHKFVSTLLEESQDLAPIFSQAVDKYFWDLV